MKLFNHRKFYDRDSLSIDEIGDNPMNFFKKWFKDAEKSDEIIESNAMTISTSDNNVPSSRVVLLKEIRDRSLIFFTNYQSKKGKAINENPNTSIAPKKVPTVNGRENLNIKAKTTAPIAHPAPK